VTVNDYGDNRSFVCQIGVWEPDRRGLPDSPLFVSVPKPAELFRH
jgi:hypothetical protein